MTRSSYATIACLLLLFVAAACSKPVQNPAGESSTASPPLAEDKRIASVSVVKATPQPVELAAGSYGEAQVRLAIQNGYHINANPPSYSYLIPTALEISPADGVSLGSVTYPKPVSKKFVFAEKPLAVYEGETEVKATLKADKSAKQGQHSLAAKLRIQACDEQVCYPPGTLDLVIPVTIK
jgi:DsbC/DsbD-like thiol-disulfide interchange protein